MIDIISKSRINNIPLDISREELLKLDYSAEQFQIAKFLLGKIQVLPSTNGFSLRYHSVIWLNSTNSPSIRKTSVTITDMLLTNWLFWLKHIRKHFRLLFYKCIEYSRCLKYRFQEQWRNFFIYYQTIIKITRSIKVLTSFVFLFSFISKQF